MDSFYQDVRYALRLFRRAPGFTAIAIITLALGIGANTAIFSVVNAVLLKPLPFHQHGRLVMVWERNYLHEKKANTVGPSNFIAWRERNTVFDEMAGVFRWESNVTGAGDPERVPIAMASPTLFPMIGVQPIIGRTFAPEEDQPGKDNVVLLSERYWRGHFGSDRSVIGRTIKLGSQPAQIIGVVPESAALAARWNLGDSVAASDPLIWIPFTIDPAYRKAGGRWMSVVARLKPGVTLQDAQTQMLSIAKQLEQERPDFDKGWDVMLVPIREQLVRGVRPALLVLLAAVGLVLLIAAVNVANLLLARAAAREREVAIRAALGIRRGRLIRQLLTESAVLSLVGGALGIFVAYWALAALLLMVPAGLPRIAPIAIDVRVLLVTLGVSIAIGLLFGLAPALHGSRVNLNDALKEGGRTSTSAGHRWTRNALVISEAALAVLLLVGAGLTIRSFIRLLSVPTGFNPEDVLTAQINLPQAKYSKSEQQVRFFQELVARLGKLPGVEAAGLTSFFPLAGPGSATDFSVDDQPPVAKENLPVADVRAVTADYFRAIGTPLLQGRFFNDSDRAEDKVKKVLINESMAKTFWPGQDPLGKRISMEWYDMMHAEVIGVVPDVAFQQLDKPPGWKNQIYWYLPQFPNAFGTLVVRTKGEPQAIAGSLRATVAALDPELPISKVQTADEIVSASVRQPRFTMVLLAIFAGLALTLAVIGLYGVVSYAVTQRTHELGVRMALGASSADVLRLVLREGMLLAAFGVMTGAAVSLIFTRFLRSMLFGIGAADALTFAAVCAIVLAWALLATYVPARRAARVDPMIALRYE